MYTIEFINRKGEKITLHHVSVNWAKSLIQNFTKNNITYTINKEAE